MRLVPASCLFPEDTGEHLVRPSPSLLLLLLGLSTSVPPLPLGAQPAGTSECGRAWQLRSPSGWGAGWGHPPICRGPWQSRTCTEGLMRLRPPEARAVHGRPSRRGCVVLRHAESEELTQGNGMPEHLVCARAPGHQ